MPKGIGIVLTILCCFTLLHFFRFSLYPESPIDSISRKEIIDKLPSSSNTISFLTADHNFLYYITSFEKGKANGKIITRMEQSGYTYKTQEGAALIFDKSGKQVIISTQMWTKRFVIFKVPTTIGE